MTHCPICNRYTPDNGTVPAEEECRCHRIEVNPTMADAVIRADELEAAEVVAYDGQARTITLRFELMPCAAIGEKWLVRPNMG